MNEVDPSTFGAANPTADAGVGDPARQPELEPGGRHAVAEGHPEPTTSTDALWDALSSTAPNTPLEQVESPWNPADGGMARIFRGIQKMTGADGLPAWADLLIGSAEFARKMNDKQSGSADAPAAGESEEIEFA